MRNTAWIRYTIAVIALLVGFGFSVRLSDRGLLFDSHAPDALASAPEEGEVYDLQALTILNRVLLQMKDNYVEPDRIDPLAMLAHSLEARGFTFTQYLDIFKGFSKAVKNIINDYFGNIHGKNLTEIISNLPPEQISQKFMTAEGITEEMTKKGVIENRADTLPIDLGGKDVNDSRSSHVDGTCIGGRAAHWRLGADICDEIQHRVRLAVEGQHQCCRNETRE